MTSLNLRYMVCPCLSIGDRGQREREKMDIEITDKGKGWMAFRLHGIQYMAYHRLLKVTDASHNVLNFSDFKAQHGIELADYFSQES